MKFTVTVEPDRYELTLDMETRYQFESVTLLREYIDHLIFLEKEKHERDKEHGMH